MEPAESGEPTIKCSPDAACEIRGTTALSNQNPGDIKVVLYRRNRIEGGSYFFTVTLRDRRSTMLADHIELLRESVRHTKHAQPFHINA